MLEFECRLDEYLEARRAVARLDPIEYWLVRAWGPALIVAGLWVIARAPIDSTGYLVAAVGVGLVLNGTLWFRHRVRVEWRETPSLRYRTWMAIRDTGLLFASVDGGQTTVSWSSLEEIIETAATFVLRRGPDDIYVIPKRAFSSRARVESFRARLAAVSARRGDGSAAPSFRFQLNRPRRTTRGDGGPDIPSAIGR
jgi:YcxB-like protein